MNEQDKETRMPDEEIPKPEAPVPAPDAEDEHKGGNPHFAIKVLAILVAIIAVILILQCSGVPVAIRDWFSAATQQINFPIL